jgi:acyl carrier protein
MTVEEKVKEISCKILRRADIDFNSVTTFKDLGADSLDIVQIMVAVEEAYDIELPEEEMQEVKNVKDFLAFIERKVGAKK